VLQVKFGVRQGTFQQYAALSLRTPIAQYYGIVQDGLFQTQHVFRGLNRPLLHDGDMKADETVLVYTWRSPIDWEWAGTPQYGRPLPVDPPPGRVFVVLVREEEPNENDVVGSIERWNWVREDPLLSHAPVGWEQRYGRKLWSRET